MLLSARHPTYPPVSPKPHHATPTLNLPRCFEQSPPSPPPSHPPPPPLSPGSKTAAFFSSPSTSPRPPPHAELASSSSILSHPPSLRPGHPASSGARSLTVDFFASPPSRPTAPASLRSVSSYNSLSSRTDSESSVDTPDDVHISIDPPASSASSSISIRSSKSKTDAFFASPAATPPPPPTTSTSRSLTADFFAASPPRPTPPPSLRSIPSNSSLSSHISHTSFYSTNSNYTPAPPEDATPKPPPVLPSLAARLFPSRYGAKRRDVDDWEGESRSSPQRTFVELDELEMTASPSSTEFSINSPPLSPTRRGSIPHDHPPESDTDDAAAAPARLHSGSTLRHAGRAFSLETRVGAGAFSHVWKARDEVDGSAVAVKILSRRAHGGRLARAERAAFQREVDILQHLDSPHASLPTLHAAFSVRGADVLVLEYIRGGELLDLVNEDAAHALLSERVLRRMWSELAGVVAWLHERNVVHRDIKLENILLTTRFPTLPPPSQPLLKLTDFGLARAIDPSDPWLRTRCGSESYAAPELLLAAPPTDADDDNDEDADVAHLSRAPTDGGRHRVSRIGAGSGSGEHSRENVEVKPRREGAYDGRETDAWALGVVLFALATRGLPFDPPLAVEGHAHGHAHGAERRAWVRRVLKGEVVWPEVPPVAAGEEDEEVRGEALGGVDGVREIVGKLLVREPERRARVADVAGGW